MALFSKLFGKKGDSFDIKGDMTVADLKRQFEGLFGGRLRVYTGTKVAADDATLESIGAKKVSIPVDLNVTVADFIKEIQQKANLKVKIYTNDDWVAVLDDIVVGQVRFIPNAATKDKMAPFVGKMADETVDTGKKVTAANALTISGNKKISTVKKEFNERFPYLYLGIYESKARDLVAKGQKIQQIDGDKTIGSVRRVNVGGEVSVNGMKQIGTLEKDLDAAFGLYVQVYYIPADGGRYYTSGSDDKKTLNAFNTECEKNGCQKNQL